MCLLKKTILYMSLQEAIISIVFGHVKYPLPWPINNGDLGAINPRSIYLKRWFALKKGDLEFLSLKSENRNSV